MNAPAPEGAPAGTASRSLTPWLLVLLGALLDFLATPPALFAPAIFVADVPFLLLLWYQGGKRWKRWALLYGMVHFGVTTRWLVEVSPIHPLATALFLSPVYVLFGGAIRMCVRARMGFVLSVGLCAVLEEWTRTWWLGGMPWPARSLSFAGTEGIPLDGLLPGASFLGAYGLSFLAAVTSAWASGLPALARVSSAMRGPMLRRLAVGALVPLATFAVLLWQASDRRAAYEARQKLQPPSSERAFSTPGSFVVVQGNIAQSLKNKAAQGGGRFDPFRDMIDPHIQMSKLGVTVVGGPQVLGVLWPETMQPIPFTDAVLAARFPKLYLRQNEVVQRIRDAVPEAQDVPWWIGALVLFQKGEAMSPDIYAHGTYDSLVQIEPRYAPPTGAPIPPPEVDNPAWFPPWMRGHHDKRVLVPGGEYTPLGDIVPPLRWFRSFVSAIPELDPGDQEQQPFVLWEGIRHSRLRRQDFTETIRGGTVVCFEIAFPARCREWREQGADVLLNPANYGWFGETTFRAQIRAVARLRAAETGMAVVMAGNSGPTLFLDPLGRMHGTFHPGDRSPSRPAGTDDTTHQLGAVTAPLHVDQGSTPYLTWGDAPWLLAGFVWLLFAWLAPRLRRRAAQRASEANNA